MTRFSASKARLYRRECVRRRLHSLLNAPTRTTGPSLRSENELALSLRITTFFPFASRVPTTRAMVTASAKGTVGDRVALKTGNEESPSNPVEEDIGGPLGTSPTASRTDPGVSKTGFQNRFRVLSRRHHPNATSAVTTAKVATAKAIRNKGRRMPRVC